MAKTKRSKTKSRRVARIISLIGFIVSTCVLLYPYASNLWNQHVDDNAIRAYNSKVSADKQVYNRMYQDAVNYNLSISGQVVTDAAFDTSDSTYDTLMDPTGNGIIGYIEIPCIDITDPIYHYSTDAVLQKGIGHIHGSSLPVGGKSTHAVLTGHRGLPAQKLFTDLNKVEKGDKFYIHVLGKTLAYKVTSIKIVLPEDTEVLKVEPGQDLVTLVTCTPYGVNTHRLLVTGKRVPYTGKKAVGAQAEKHTRQIDRGLVVFFGFLLFFILFRIISGIRKYLAAKQRKKSKPDC